MTSSSPGGQPTSLRARAMGYMGSHPVEYPIVGGMTECHTARMGTRQLALYVIAAVLGAVAVVAFITAKVKSSDVNPFADPVGPWESGTAWALLGAGAAAVGILVLGMGLAVHAIADELAMVRSAERVRS